jgi:hypothetical protein
MKRKTDYAYGKEDDRRQHVVSDPKAASWLDRNVALGHLAIWMRTTDSCTKTRPLARDEHCQPGLDYMEVLIQHERLIEAAADPKQSAQIEKILSTREAQLSKGRLNVIKDINHPLLQELIRVWNDEGYSYADITDEDDTPFLYSVCNSDVFHIDDLLLELFRYSGQITYVEVDKEDMVFILRGDPKEALQNIKKFRIVT